MPEVWNKGHTVQRGRFGAGVVLLLATLCRPAMADEPLSYADAMSRAAALERAGKPDEAARVIESVADTYAQDFFLQLRLGWLTFQAGRYHDSEAAYRRALELNPDDRDARHGLAWALFKGGKTEQAHAEFKAVVDRWPDTELAKKGLEASRPPPPVVLAPSLVLIGQVHQDHPVKDGAVGLSFSLPVTILDHGLVSATYRFGHFLSNSDSVDDFEQHEAHVSLGLTWPGWGVAAHYGYIHDGSYYTEYGYVAGLSARFSPWGDILVEASASIYPDMEVYRLSPAYHLPLLSWLSLTPTVAVQVAHSEDNTLQLEQTTEPLFSGGLTVTLHHRLGDVWVGGKYGDEVRPAYLTLPAVYNTADRIAYGFWLGGRAKLGRGFSLSLGYELVHMETQTTSTLLYQSNLHLITFGAGWSSL